MEKPANSQTTLQNPNSPLPTFLPDVAGNYLAELIVTNANGEQSDSSTVALSTSNVAPVAMAGDDRAMTVGQTLRLDPEGTYDANGDRLEANWSILGFIPVSDSENEETVPAANPGSDNETCPITTIESLGIYHVVSATSQQQSPQLAVGTPLPEGTVETGSNSATTYYGPCLLYTSPSPRDKRQSRMPSSA